MSKSLELDPKIENADIRQKEIEFKIKSIAKVIHLDFLTFAGAMPSALCAIEKNQA